MGAIIPVYSGGGGGGGGIPYRQRYVDDSGMRFLASMMEDRPRSDPNATLALLLQLAMQRESLAAGSAEREKDRAERAAELAEMRRQFNETLEENKRHGQFAEQEQKKMNEAIIGEMGARSDLADRQFGLLQEESRTARSMQERLLNELAVEKARGRASDVAQGVLDEVAATTIAGAEMAAKRKAVEAAETEARFAAETGQAAESVAENLAGGYEWLSPGEAPKSYQGVVDWAKNVESRALSIKDPAERARYANEASAKVGELLSEVRDKGFDTTSPWADINPVSWLYGGARMMMGKPFNAADTTYKQSAIDRLKSSRFLLGKLADPAINEREALESAEDLASRLVKVKGAKRQIQSDISRLGATTTRPADFAMYEAEVGQRLGELLANPNASTTTSIPQSQPNDWAEFEWAMRNPASRPAP